MGFKCEMLLTLLLCDLNRCSRSLLGEREPSHSSVPSIACAVQMLPLCHKAVMESVTPILLSMFKFSRHGFQWCCSMPNSIGLPSTLSAGA